MSDSLLLLPVRTLYLAGRYVVPLVLWFTVGRLLSFLLVTYGADLTLKWPYVTWGAPGGQADTPRSPARPGIETRVGQRTVINETRTAL